MVNTVHLCLQAPHESYSVFMLLGNDKLPIVVGLGHVNFYMCQVGTAALVPGRR